MTTDKTMLNFRCPNDLLSCIDEIGRQRYPVDNTHGCDRSKTLMDIIQAGIQALSDGSVVLPVPVERKTLEDDSKTLTSTEVEAMIQKCVAAAMTSVQVKLESLDLRLGKLKAW